MQKLSALIAFVSFLFVAEAADPGTIAVEKKPFGVIVDFKGVAFPTKAAEVVLWPKGMLSATIESVVAHGTRVAMGDSLISFNTRALKDSVTKQEAAIRQAELALKQAKDSLAQFQKTKAYRLKAAEQALKVATENLKRFTKDLGPSDQRVAKYQMKSLKEQLAYAEEELKQLEKMYKEDQVTEESEEIVLTRQRNYVDRLRFVINENAISLNQKLKYTIPREKKALETQLETATIALAKLNVDLPAELKSKELAVEQKLLALKDAREVLAKHKYNLSILTVKAPAAGIVYYGYFRDGRWSVDEARRMLRKGGTIRKGAVVMSIVSPSNVVIEASVNEAQAQFLKAGQKALIMPTAHFGARLGGKVLSVSARPTAPGKHSVTVAINVPEGKTLPVYAGATCSVRIVPYKKEGAIVLDKKRVYEDKLNNSQRYVWLLPKDAKKGVRRDVTVGYVSGEEIEITSGLNEGDRVLKEAPKGK